MQNATQWKEVFKTAIQAAIVLVLLDRLGLVGGEPWLEGLLDTLSVQATMLHGRAVTWAQGLRDHLQFTKRLEAK